MTLLGTASKTIAKQDRAMLGSNPSGLAGNGTEAVPGTTPGVWCSFCTTCGGCPLVPSSNVPSPKAQTPGAKRGTTSRNEAGQ